MDSHLRGNPKELIRLTTMSKWHFLTITYCKSLTKNRNCYIIYTVYTIYHTVGIEGDKYVNANDYKNRPGTQG